MTQGKLVTPEAQQQVLTYLELKKSTKWIATKTGLSISTVQRIKKREGIKYSNEYVSPPGTYKGLWLSKKEYQEIYSKE